MTARLDTELFPGLPVPEVRDLAEGERLVGAVVRLPSPGAAHGNQLVLRIDGGGVRSITATAKRGWTVLHRELRNAQVEVGDTITVHFVRWDETADGRRYQLVRVVEHEDPRVKEEDGQLRCFAA